MRDMAQVRTVIGETLSRDFQNVRIIDVRVHADKDADGDEILRVEVIFDGTPKDLDARKVSGVIRHLRPRLSAIQESAFPLLSFISNREVGLAGA